MSERWKLKRWTLICKNCFMGSEKKATSHFLYFSFRATQVLPFRSLLKTFKNLENTVCLWSAILIFCCSFCVFGRILRLCCSFTISLTMKGTGVFCPSCLSEFSSLASWVIRKEKSRVNHSLPLRLPCLSVGIKTTAFSTV